MSRWHRYLSWLQRLAAHVPARLCVWMLVLLSGVFGWQLAHGVSGIGLLPAILVALWCLLGLLMQQMFARPLAVKPAGPLWRRAGWLCRLAVHHLCALLFLMLAMVCLFWSAKLLSVILRASL